MNEQSISEIIYLKGKESFVVGILLIMVVIILIVPIVAIFLLRILFIQFSKIRKMAMVPVNTDSIHERLFDDTQIV